MSVFAEHLHVVWALLVVALIFLIWRVVLVRASKEEFIAALIKLYGTTDDNCQATSANCSSSYFAWKEQGRAVVRFSGMSKIGVTRDTVIIKQRPFIRSIIPTVEIPKNRLTYVRTEFIWSALRRFDVFNVKGVPGGQLLLPVSLAR